MLPSSTLSKGKKTACELCRSRKRRCDGRLPSCSRCHKAQLRCIYAKRSPYGSDVGVMVHAASGEFSPIQADTGLAQADDIPTPIHYSSSQYLDGIWSFRQFPNSTPAPINWDWNSSSAMSPYGFSSYVQEWMQHPPTQLHVHPSDLNSNVSAFAYIPQPAPGATGYLPQGPVETPSPAESSAGSNQSGVSSPSQLPDRDRVVDMVKSFFSAQHQLLPSVHMESFMTKISNDIVGLSAGPFLWVVLALYCSCNKSEAMQAQYCSWMHTAHLKLELMSTRRVRGNTTNMLQASIWMIFDAYCRGDVTVAWLLLGRTAQLTSALGLNRIDSTRRAPRTESEVESRSDIEVEECRKCMWCLALLDRVIVSVNGLALSMDERYFHVNFPLPDDVFQAARISLEDVEYLREPYSFKAFDLLNGNTTSEMARKPTFEHVLKISLILGRAMAIQNSVCPDDGSSQQQDMEKLRTLESVLNTFCYAVSVSDDGVGPSSLFNFWLKMLTQCSKIMILHPPGPSALALCDCLNSSSPTDFPPKADTECTRAAVNAARKFSRALEGPLLALNNPFLLPMACTAVRMLTLRQRQMDEADRTRTKELIQDIVKVIDLVAIKFPGAAEKARDTITAREAGPEHHGRSVSTGCYVGLDCQ